MKSIVKSLYAIIYPGMFDSSKARLYTALYELHRSGLTLSKIAELLVQRVKEPKVEKVAQAFAEQAASGKDFSDSIKTLSPYLGEWDCRMLVAGEQSGTLEEIFFYLRNYYRKKVQLKQKISGAAMAPLVTLLLFVFFFSLVDLLLFGIWRYVMVTLVPLAVVTVVVAVCWAILLHLSHVPGIGSSMQIISLALPVIGPARRTLITVRFGRLFSLLNSAGLEIQQTLRLAAGATGMASVQNAIEKLFEQDSSETTLDALFSRIPFLDKTFVDDVTLAAETGRADIVAVERAEELEMHLQQHLDNLLPILMKILIIPILIAFFFFKLLSTGMTIIMLFWEKLQPVLHERFPFLNHG